MLLTLSLATFVLLVVTLLPLWRHPHWMVRGLDFPRLQFTLTAFILLLCQLLLLDFSAMSSWLLLTLTLLCLAWHLCWIIAYTPLWPVEVKAAAQRDTERDLSIITANVLTTNRDADALLTLVRHYQPDVLVTLESDLWWQQQLTALEDFMPYSIKCPLDNLYGMHVFSRLPLEQAETSFLVEDEVPSMHALLQLRNGVQVRMHFLHPAPPSPLENTQSAERDAELMIVARSLAGCEQPVVVTGDLNDVAWSPTTRLFRKVSGLLDPRVGRGLFNTFHADYPFFRWPLDHLFHSRHFTLHSIQRLPPIGSDHFALFTQLSFAPQQGKDQQPLSAKDADYSRARDISDQRDATAADVPRPGDSAQAFIPSLIQPRPGNAATPAGAT